MQQTPHPESIPKITLKIITTRLKKNKNLISKSIRILFLHLSHPLPARLLKSLSRTSVRPSVRSELAVIRAGAARSRNFTLNFLTAQYPRRSSSISLRALLFSNRLSRCCRPPALAYMHAAFFAECFLRSVGIFFGCWRERGKKRALLYSGLSWIGQ